MSDLMRIRNDAGRAVKGNFDHAEALTILAECIERLTDMLHGQEKENADLRQRIRQLENRPMPITDLYGYGRK